MRYWSELNSDRLFGTDFNQNLIEWCKRRLPFATYQINHLAPPLIYRSDWFDFIYARSIFTHLPEKNQSEWLRELKRILKPKGLFLFTVSGSAFYDFMRKEERDLFDQGQLVVREAKHPGKNLCAVFHPSDWVLSLLSAHGLKVIDRIPGIPDGYLYQDAYLVQN